MYNAILIGIGGFIGALLRYIVSGYVQKFLQSINFPYGTLVVNIVGCFLMGIFSYITEINLGLTSQMRLFLMIGLLGSFTTFSTFGNETINLLLNQRTLASLINIGGHIFLGLLSVLIGRLLGILIWK